MHYRFPSWLKGSNWVSLQDYRVSPGSFQEGPQGLGWAKLGSSGNKSIEELQQTMSNNVKFKSELHYASDSPVFSQLDGLWSICIALYAWCVLPAPCNLCVRRRSSGGCGGISLTPPPPTNPSTSSPPSQLSYVTKPRLINWWSDH